MLGTRSRPITTSVTPEEIGSANNGISSLHYSFGGDDLNLCLSQ